MGSRDIKGREKKKIRKDIKKQPIISSTLETPRPEVEIIRTKGKKPKDIEEEE